jgi:hypothetical protein
MGETCTWVEDVDNGIWVTGSGRFFGIYEGTPPDYQMHWCPYCGKILQEVLKDPKD